MSWENNLPDIYAGGQYKKACVICHWNIVIRLLESIASISIFTPWAILQNYKLSTNAIYECYLRISICQHVQEKVVIIKTHVTILVIGVSWIKTVSHNIEPQPMEIKDKHKAKKKCLCETIHLKKHCMVDTLYSVIEDEIEPPDIQLTRCQCLLNTFHHRLL